MTLTILIPRERAPDEKRVAATPETVKKLCDLKASVLVESGAGDGAQISDQAFESAGARIIKNLPDGLSSADIVITVQAPLALKDAKLRENTVVIGLMNPTQEEKFIAQLIAQKARPMALERVPRITRAQAMDVLSSQANLAGYKAVLLAAEHYGRIFPMMMTAAGTLPPAKVFVMGAGVAGLQAIATARRLGAVVSATDVRPASKEQVQSLGGTFIAVEDEEFKQAETTGGYAKEMSAEYKAKQAELVASHIAKQDIIITTALIPGRTAPVLVTRDMVESMKPGSVIVDLAAASGGNCAVTENGKVTVHKGVTIIGHSNIPALLATDASALYARNVLALLALMIDKETGTLKSLPDDEIIKGISLMPTDKKEG